MRMLWALFALVAAGIGLGVAWQMGMLRTASVEGPPVMHALHAHFASQGIRTRSRPIKSRTSDISFINVFEMQDANERRFYINIGSSDAGARREFELTRTQAPQTLPEISGRLVLYMPDPAPGRTFDAASDLLAERVRQAFRSFDGGRAP